MTVILDPKWTPSKSVRVGKELAFTWLTINGLPLPDQLTLDRGSAGGFLEKAWLGVHSSKKGVSRIAIATEDCCFSGRFNTPQGQIIQAPGSFEDLSALGVLCHEVGHHVDYFLNPRTYSRSKVSGFSVAINEEEEISRGEFNVRESFAEAIRLFITNPDLLRRGRPARWDHLTQKLRFRTLHQTHWKTILRKAPQYVHRAAKEWIESE